MVIAIIALIIGAAAGAGVTYFAVTRLAPATSQTTLCNSPFAVNAAGCAQLCSSSKTLTIGELLDLSSDLSDQGTKAKDSSGIAITDVNNFLASNGCSLRFTNAISDYKLDNPTALSNLQSFAASGVQVVVGPLNSGTAQYILSYANSNHIVLISPSSTSPALAISNDYLFRTVPNDAAQGLADARIMYERGASAVIIVQRHDTYGDGLANATRDRFNALAGSGRVIDIIQYDTKATDFTNTITTLYNDFQAANTTYPNKVAIDAISFEEFGSLIIQTNTQHPSLLNGKLPWFGTDGEAANSKILTGSSAALTAQVRLPSTLFAPANNTKTNAFYTAFSSKYPTVSCDSYCLGAYDDVWLAAVSTIQAGAYNGTAIQANMLNVASTFYGVTGWMGLQPSGDRIPTSYVIWKAINPASPKWIIAGSWDQATDTVTWTSPP